MKRGCWIAIALLHASTAYAFTEPRTYSDTPAHGGGGGRFFTGSPAEGYGCAVCHTGPGRTWPLSIEGLPDDGYEPGETYELVLRFEELSEHGRERREQGKVPPAMGLVAELLAENGVGAGKLTISPADEAEDGELCVLPPGQRATQLYRVRPGEPTREAGLACEASSLGQRCVMATLSCGASELRVRWTAPEQAQGPIWFSGGFVTAERATGDTKNDSVTAISEILLPKGASQDYATSTLESGCSAAPGRGGALGWLAMLGLLVGFGIRRRARRRVLALALASLALLGCDEDRTLSQSEYAAHPNTGLFAPGNLIGADPDALAALDASVDGGDGGKDTSAFDDAISEASGQDRCVERDGEPGVKGTLEIEFKTASYGGFYAPANCGAVWIEDEDGAYVATPMIWAGLRARNIFVWDARRCRADMPDAISSATLEEHGMLLHARWDGKDQTGAIVPDGSYVLNIEVTEDEFDYGRRLEVPFERGREPFTLTPDDSESVKGLKLTYTPKP